MKVLLPVDGSTCANKTIEWAASIFDKQTTEYYLLHVVPILPETGTIEFKVSDAKALLSTAQSLLEGLGCTVKEAGYQLGDITDQVCRYADLMSIDQVVIGSHGRSGLSKLLIGSVGESVLEHCRKSVVVYRNVEPKAQKSSAKTSSASQVTAQAERI